MRTREEQQESRMNADKTAFFKGEKIGTIFWNLSSEMIGVYLWFLRFSHFLLKLIQ